MIDNFELIKELLSFDSKDEFYFVQVLKRKKEHPELESNSVMVMSYYIKSVEDLDRFKAEMICLAEFHNARVCINLNRCSFESVAFQTLRKVTDIIMNKDFKSVRKAYNSVCGIHTCEPEKKWILDIDNFEPSTTIEDKLYHIKPVGPKVIAKIPTKNGYHLITRSFNMQEFSKLNIECSIHRNNPTILFCP